MYVIGLQPAALPPPPPPGKPVIVACGPTCKMHPSTDHDGGKHQHFRNNNEGAFRIGSSQVNQFSLEMCNRWPLVVGEFLELR